MNRRHILSGLALALATPARANAQDFEPAPLPPGLDPKTAPGLSWAGAGPAAIEIFDYNCPYCRAVFQTLDARIAKKTLRLGLIDSPQLSIGSIQAAKLRQAALRLYGPAKAYAFHRRLFSQRGATRAFSDPIESDRGSSFLFLRVFLTRTGIRFAGKRSNGDSGLAAARALHFDVAKLTETADSDDIRDILVGAAQFLNKAGARATPSFMIGGQLLTGWPGPQGFDALLKKAS
jgi:protein-disulfide isomerase